MTRTEAPIYLPDYRPRKHALILDALLTNSLSRATGRVSRNASSGPGSWPFRDVCSALPPSPGSSTGSSKLAGAA